MLDPRELLGVPVDAAPADVRRAHARLVAHLVNGGAPDELVILLADARDAAIGGRALALPTAHFLLGVSERSADDDDIRHAWRRVAAVAHPDRGGTAALFRLVNEAHDELIGRDTRRRRRAATRRGYGGSYNNGDFTAWAAPSRPPPRGPFRAPKPEDRVLPPRRQAIVELAFGGAALGANAFMASIPWLLLRERGIGIAVALAVAGLFIGRGVLHDAVRALVRLWGMRGAIAENEAPDRFLAERALDAPVGRVDQSLLYDAYLRWCRTQGGRGVSPWRFVEELRSYGLLYVHGGVGDSARWVGLRLRDMTT